MTPQYHSSKDAKGRNIHVFQFAAEICEQCPLQDQCTKSQRGRTISIQYHAAYHQYAKAYEQTEEFDEKKRLRPLIERLIAELKQLGINVAHYFGTRKLNYQLNLTAAAANLRRLAKALKEKSQSTPGIGAPNLRGAALKTAS